MEEEVGVDNGCITGVISLLHLLLYDHELNLDQVEKCLYGLFGFFALLRLIITATIGNDAHQLVDHHLVLNCLIVVADLQKVVCNLLINIDLLLQVRNNLQNFRLIINGLFVVLEALQIRYDELQRFNLHVHLNLAGREYLQDVRELLIRFHEVARELVRLCQKDECFLDIAVADAVVVNLELDLEGKFRRLDTLLEVL